MKSASRFFSWPHCRATPETTSSPFLTDEERIEILFLATLSRYARDDELDRMRTFVQETETPTEGISTAFADILWALLNSAEFTVNH